MQRLKDLFKRLFHIEDTPERTALAFSVGIFLGFSPFLGFHTLAGIAVALLFGLNRVAVLIGVWSNTPWWIVPYYGVATGLGIWITGVPFGRESIRETFHLALEKGSWASSLWSLLSQSGLLSSFITGSLVLAAILSLIAYPLSLKAIRFYRLRKK